MFDRAAADAVLFIHFTWIAFLIIGFPVLLWLNSARWRLFHLAGLTAMLAMQLTGTVCPMTYLEVYFRSRGRASEVYPGQFLTGALEKIIYVDDRTLQYVFYATAIYTIAAVISFFVRPLKKS